MVSATQFGGYALLAAVPLVFLYNYYFKSSPPPPPKPAEQPAQPKSIMQPPAEDLDPPKDDPFTLDDLKPFDGSDLTKPIYVAIKRTVFDVTKKVDVYGKGKSYNVFAGKDGSRGLGMSSLKTEDAVPDYSTLDTRDRKTLDDWHAFFSKRYNVVGKVVGVPDSE